MTNIQRIAVRQWFKNSALQYFFTTLLVLSYLLLPCASANANSFWVTAYYPVWEQHGHLPPDKIDYHAFTHLIQFSIMPTSTGQIDQSDYNAVTPAISTPVVALAHKAGDKVLICVGGMGSGPALSAVIAPNLRAAFVKNLVSFVKQRGYDGIDIDMEPITATDAGNYEAFVYALRQQLSAANKRYLLTAAASSVNGPQTDIFAKLANQFDQINIMSYDLSGPWRGFKSWYNSSLFGDGSQMLADGVPYPSVSEILKRYADAGVPTSKSGIGIAFYGYVWTGVSGPTQGLDGVTVQSLGYGAIMDQYGAQSKYHWDSAAHAPYLSVQGTSPSQSKFISYDDDKLCAEKIAYARQHHYGGVILFELGQAYRPSQPPGKQDLLLQAVKSAWRSNSSKTPK